MQLCHTMIKPVCHPRLDMEKVIHYRAIQIAKNPVIKIKVLLSYLAIYHLR